MGFLLLGLGVAIAGILIAIVCDVRQADYAGKYADIEVVNITLRAQVQWLSDRNRELSQTIESSTTLVDKALRDDEPKNACVILLDPETAQNGD